MSVVILPILAAILLAFPFFNFDLWLFGWCGFIPLFIALENKSLRQSFMAAYLWGIVFWGLTLYWLIHVTFVGQIVLILYLAIYFAIFGWVIYFSRFFSLARRLFFVPSAWVLLEYLRSYLFSGFPWSLIGHSQYKNLPVIQIAEITGAWGVSFLVALVNVAFYLILRKQLRAKSLLICAGIVFLSLAYGFYKLSYRPDFSRGEKSLKISVVQGNIPQHLKWDKQSADFILNNYLELTAAAAKKGPDLIIWPEASVPGLWGRDDAEFAQVFSLAGQLHTNLLIGAVSYFNQNYFNSALFIDYLGAPGKIYNKLHLVPFGEYIPLKNIFPFLETIALIGDIQPGREYTIFKLHSDQVMRPVGASGQPANTCDSFSTNLEESGGGGFGVLICFEDLFPELSREFIKRGARFLVNITNDAWYKEGSAPYQHLAASVFRSVENRVYLARAANTGISGFIDPAGRILRLVQNAQGKEIFVQGYSDMNICLATGKRTIYNRYGDFFIVFCLLLDMGIIILALRKK